MVLDGEVGQGVFQDGAREAFRLTRYGGLAVCDSNARYWDAVMRGNCFYAAQQAAAAFGTALTATAVTLTLYNPVGSQRNLVLIEATASVASVTVAGQVVYAINNSPGQAAPASVTKLASGIQNCLIGAGNNSIAAVYSAATLPAAPLAARVFFSCSGTSSPTTETIMDPIDGKLIITPGSMVTIQGITTNATGILSMMWEEVLNP